MTLVPAKCPECGGNVVVDNEKDAWICDFCKTPFIVEKAIQTFNTTYNTTNVSNVTNNNDIKADVVNVYENKVNDFVIKAGQLVEYNGLSMDVEIPEEVIYIGHNALPRKIHSISLHDKVEEIETGAFIGRDQLEEIDLSHLKIENCPSFYGCKRLKKVAIPEGIQVIDSRAFQDCSMLKEINLPKSLKRIKDFAFSDCKSLESIIIPENVSFIGEYAFLRCRQLKSIDIRVNKSIFIDVHAFAGVPGGGGPVVKRIIDSRISAERIKRENAEKKRVEEEARRIEEERNQSADILEARIKEYFPLVLRDNYDNNRCPICGKIHSLKRKAFKREKFCTNTACRAYNRNPEEVAREIVQYIRKGECPSCGKALRTVSCHSYCGNAGEEYVVIHCTSFGCRLYEIWFLNRIKEGSWKDMVLQRFY